MSNNDKWIEMHYVDLAGRTHAVSVPYDALHKEVYIDASSVDMLDISNSDLLLRPIEDTITELPWDRNTYRALTSMWDGESRFWGDSRWVAEKTNSYLTSKNYRVVLGAEVEFFIHKVRYEVNGVHQYLTIVNDEEAPYGVFSKKRAYQAIDLGNVTYNVRVKAIKYLSLMGIAVKKAHHEVAPNQSELVTPSGSPEVVGDYIVTLKYVVRKVARELGYVANFMPKPIANDNGSGMHVHVSLWLGNSNLFWDNEENISQLGRYFIGGILEHGRSLAAIVAPTVNSYKRLVPGFEAPIYLAWGFSNRSVAVRIPKTLDPNGARIEFRVPDPLANPYLALSAITLAGLDGIQRKLDPGDPLKTNSYQLRAWEIKELGIKLLPENLMKAVEELETDNSFLKPVFSRELLDKYIEIKKAEALRVNSIPTPAEFSAYLWW